MQRLSLVFALHVLACWGNEISSLYSQWFEFTTGWYFLGYLGRAAPLLSLLGSPSIYCIDMSRRHEVVLFTFVRACRSAYIYFKKRYKFNLNN